MLLGLMQGSKSRTVFQVGKQHLSHITGSRPEITYKLSNTNMVENSVRILLLSPTSHVCF